MGPAPGRCLALGSLTAQEPRRGFDFPIAVPMACAKRAGERHLGAAQSHSSPTESAWQRFAKRLH